MRVQLSIAGLMLVAAFGFGCSKPALSGSRAKTYPVFGIIKVDGEPAEGVYVTCYPDKEVAENKLPSGTITAENGKFAFSTYSANDGLPKGTYKLVFKWNELGIGKTVDRLGGAYAKAAKSKFEFVVGNESSVDLGVIELSKTVSKK